MNTKIGLIARASVFLIALCAAGTASAIATGGDLGTLNLGDDAAFAYVHNGNGITFADEWTFTLSSPGNVSVFLEDEDVSFSTAFFSIDGLSGGIDGLPDDGLVFTVNGLAAGLHTLYVAGKTVGDFGGFYSGVLTAVPLPPAVILFGSVLFGFSVVARKRNRSALAA